MRSVGVFYRMSGKRLISSYFLKLFVHLLPTLSLVMQEIVLLHNFIQSSKIRNFYLFTNAGKYSHCVFSDAAKIRSPFLGTFWNNFLLACRVGGGRGVMCFSTDTCSSFTWYDDLHFEQMKSIGMIYLWLKLKDIVTFMPPVNRIW